MQVTVGGGMLRVEWYVMLCVVRFARYPGQVLPRKV